MTNQNFLTRQKGRLFSLCGLLLFNLAAVPAAELAFTPAVPVIEVGQQISLSVSGTRGKITWTPNKGRIQGVGNQVTYVAPFEAGVAGVLVADSADKLEMVKILVTQKQTVLRENATWKIFTHRSLVQAQALSEDGETLWVATRGGLEQRNANTGQLQRVLTNLDGLHQVQVTALVTDNQGGLWIGNEDHLIYLNNSNKWRISGIFNSDKSSLPGQAISSLAVDKQGGLWVGTYGGGLSHLTESGQWETFNTNNSPLPSDQIRAIVSDDNGLWVGMSAGGGLAQLNNGQWQVFNTDNSDLPNNEVIALVKDGEQGLWIGTNGGGLVHINQQRDWKVFNSQNSPLPNDIVPVLLNDGRQSLWAGTWGGGLVQLREKNWLIFNTENSGLPHNGIKALSKDMTGRLWIGTWGAGIARFNGHDKWRAFEDDTLPKGNVVSALANDGNGGVWVGTHQGGFAHLNHQDEWRIFNIDSSGFLSDHFQDLDIETNQVKAMISDEQGGVWVGTLGGLAHLTGTEEWQFFNTDNSELPHNIVLAMSSDNHGGVWVGTGGGLVHVMADGQWNVFTPDNSGLPSKVVNAMVSDDIGGLWVGMWGFGFAHLTHNNEWEIFQAERPEFSEVSAIEKDEQDGIWIGTKNVGLIHLNKEEEWQSFNTDNSELPNNRILSLSKDNSGGLWIGTSSGLAYRNSRSEWLIFNKENSGLSENGVQVIANDGRGGIWLSSFGLFHLSFHDKTVLCSTEQVAEETCQSLLAGRRAAIVIAGGGNDDENSLWDTTESITSYIYKVLNERGFDHDEIYYLSPQSWADFNGDGNNDHIVDGPIPEGQLTVDDIREAFSWAKTRGPLDQPLYVFFLDHGGSDRLQLSNGHHLTAATFKDILDDYQAATGNEVVGVIDACYSGRFIQPLTAPRRAMISSTGNDEAYFDRVDKQGFSRFLAKGLLQGRNFAEAFEYARQEQTDLLDEETQEPQSEDGQQGEWLKKLDLNGRFVVGDITLAVESLTPSTDLSVGQSLLLQAKVSLAQGTVKRVWAVLKPPKVNRVLDSNGTPILPYPRLELELTDSDHVWQIGWSEAVYNGDYKITFSAQDNQGNIASSDNSVIISVTGGVEPPAQAQVQLVLEKDQYRLGEPFKAELIEDLGWGYDLYAAVVMPDGNYLALKSLNDLAPPNQPKNWLTSRTQRRPATLFELTLPTGLPAGQYCLYGILSPEREDVFKTLEQGLWVMDVRCFDVLR